MFDNMRSAALVANGVVHDMRWISASIKNYPIVIAVDGGLVYCDQIGVTPNLIIGDLDSAPQHLLERYAHVPIEKFLSNKEWTDLDLAVFAVDGIKMEKIAVFGALEGRTDHALYNLQLARRYPGKLIIETERETTMVLQGTTTLDVTPGQTLSLIPLGPPAIKVNTKGLKWELHQATLDKELMSISNVCMESKVVINIGEGDVVCYLSRRM
jgi:thiamine pyrophosphokinase